MWLQMFLGDVIDNRVPSCEGKALKKNGLFCKHFSVVSRKTDEPLENLLLLDGTRIDFGPSCCLLMERLER